ncbi:MAG: PEP-CTERM sorting domain-containing protein [Syntrophobacteraceae bacterium]|nr:PEP-CTERM sorting domain-containing protein [Desulfobacteraceae bacterium]
MCLRIRKICGLSFLVAAAVILAWAGTAGAGPVYTSQYLDMYLKQNTFPSGLNEQKVYLDEDTAAVITGHVGSQNGTPLVKFSSTSDTLDAKNGFATIKAVDGYLNNITITVPGYYFEDLIFSVNLYPNANKNLVVTAVSLRGTYTNSSWFLGDGENDILVLSKLDNLMVSITVNSDYGLEAFGVDYGIDQLKQTQISGVSPVPEPCTMFLLGSGLIGVAAFRKRFGKA